MSNINRRVWKAKGHNYILFGVVVEERKTNGWSMVKVRWVIPPTEAIVEDDWQRLVNLGCVEALIEKAAQK